MGLFQDAKCFKGSLCCQLLFLILWLPSYQDVMAEQKQIASSRISSMVELAKAPTVGLFDPIEISPAVMPQYPYPTEPLSPSYPTFPARYEPILTGKCPVNFSDISNILDKTASDCAGPLAALVENVICCPQFTSLIHIFQGFFSMSSDKLVLSSTVADHCFSDIISILASRGANNTIPTICSIKSSNLTGGSCPVKDLSTFEKIVNTSKLFEACSAVDPLKECCRPICQPAIMDAALQISGREFMINNNKNLGGEVNHMDYLSDCKDVVYSYVSRKLLSDAANTAFRILSSCKVNKVCPLTFKEPSEVINACRNVAAPNPSCCSSLNIYIADLKDFSIQAYGIQGCLLRSLPEDVVFDNSTGFSFTCDLSDNIVAPWPSSSSITSMSLCAPEMSLPALPTSQTLKNMGSNSRGLDCVVLIFSFLILSASLH
ncbi:hypothetical protein QN277_007912 [Acacia crassicarpa]|uniref:SPARK domain-containing protein n=1 Tax=Acacia crassicarpa TaxID=499986 RepID=A0AAE1IQG7_9FABA|nr:hypothetical protein QN277_007912 [Acacia crassicarpa]